MTVPSGILLPGDEPLTLKEVVEGLYLVENAYERDYGFFSRSPLYGKLPLVPEEDSESQGGPRGDGSSASAPRRSKE